MKNLSILLSLVSLFAGQFLSAEESVKLDGVHLCCKACVRGVQSAVAEMDGVSAVADQDSETVVVTAPDKKSLRQGVTAILQAGFYGTSSDASFKVRDISRAKDEKVKSLTVTGVHLCCNGCVNALADALSTVKGVTGNTAERKVDTFQVEGDFNAKEVFAALNKAGFAGRVAN